MPLKYDLNTHLFLLFESDATEQSSLNTVQLRLLDRMIVKVSSRAERCFLFVAFIASVMTMPNSLSSYSFIMLFLMQSRCC